MPAIYYCLECGTPAPGRDKHCPLCKESMEDQSHQAPDPWEVAGGLDIRKIEDDDHYRRTKSRNRYRK